jgi:hypothetical protein
MVSQVVGLLLTLHIKFYKFYERACESELFLFSLQSQKLITISHFENVKHLQYANKDNIKGHTSHD